MKALKTEFKNKLQIRDYYKDEAKCKALLAQQRWAWRIVCPHCGSEKQPYITTRGYKCSDNKCYKKFSVTTGTVYENTKIKLNVWFEAIYVITAHKKGISSHQLARDLGITQKTAWFILHRVREMLQETVPTLLTGTVEIDETFITGKDKNRHESKKVGYDWKANSGMVVGALQRDGKVVTKVVTDTKSETLIPFMVKHVAPGSEVCTDENTAYSSLNQAFNHGFTVHSKKEYVRGRVHTNSIEGHWSQLKRGIIGIYHSVSNKHLQAYCNEFAYRYNTRKDSDSDRFFAVLNRSGNFVLPYKKLTKKNALGM
jgi:transposase-like protein